MSISDILVPNVYDIYANSVTTNNVIMANKFSSKPSGNITLSTAGNTDIICNTAIISSTDYNTTTGIYTVPLSGTYLLDACVMIDTGAQPNPGVITISFDILVNGASQRNAIYQVTQTAGSGHWIQPLNMSFLSNLVAGNTVSLRVAQVINTMGGPDPVVRFVGTYFQGIQL